MKKEFKLLAVGLALISGAATVARAADAAPLPAAELDFFEKKVRPVLVNSCYKCHSKQESKNRGGLEVDTREALLKGGDSGPAIVPRDTEKSLLIKAIRYTDTDLQMPPKGEKLSTAQIADLETWVKMGAPDPRSAHTVAAKSMRNLAKDHWAFKPVGQPPPPTVKDKNWVKTPIDAFILAKLEAKDLTPSPRADKRTLIRRATYDLIGLPPTPEEFDAFTRDNSPDAYAKLVDRLLKSPHYGERWGRYWLDIARYADTKGDVNRNREDPRYPHAWTYRDYVIQSFNEDKPYDRFITEQLAADKLPLGADKNPLAALGFITVGKRFGNNLNDIIDDRIDTVTKGFLGLTVTCARCHDHKFDPIPTRDYYSLHGVFASTVEPEEKPLLRPPAPTPDYLDYQKQLAAIEKEIQTFREGIEGQIRAAGRTNAAAYLLATWEVAQPTNTINRNIFIARDRKLDNGMFQRWEGYLRARQNRFDPVFQPWTEFAKLSDQEFVAKARQISAQFATNKDKSKQINPLVARQFSGNPPTNMREVAARYGTLLAEADKAWQMSLAIASRARRTEAPKLSDPNWDQLRLVLYGKDAPPNPDERQIERFFSQQTQRRETDLHAKIITLQLTHPGAPGRAMVVEDSRSPRDSKIFIRGNASSQGDVAPRQFLEALSDGKPEPFRVGSGRLELAKAIASRDNPLTARVMVNRIWLHHFGEGIVRTTSDFGARSEPPTHPELLDALASYFMDNGWSIKKLHRLIMMSNTYQQISDENPRFAQVDPGNQLLWRQNVRRLDFEAIRDSLLAIGGKLDLRLGGAPTNLTAEPYPNRRTVYGFVDRGDLATVFRTFDFADPDLTTSKRYETTVPQQALFLMNNPLVIEQARNLVTRRDFTALVQVDDRISLLYKLIAQRAPTDKERMLANRYLGGQSAKDEKAIGPVWQYGYGAYDPQAKQLRKFDSMKAFGRNTWVPSDRPNQNFGALSLNANGGHPGPNLATAAIRRWTAPQNGFIEINGTLGHADKRGDGVLGVILSSRAGEVGRYAAFNKQVPTKVARVPVSRGETIDFITLSLRDPNFDAFTWSPAIKLVATNGGGADADAQTQWSAKNDFAGPGKDGSSKPMVGWEKYAQVLLLTNELTFFN